MTKTRVRKNPEIARIPYESSTDFHSKMKEERLPDPSGYPARQSFWTLVQSSVPPLMRAHHDPLLCLRKEEKITSRGGRDRRAGLSTVLVGVADLGNADVGEGAGNVGRDGEVGDGDGVVAVCGSGACEEGEGGGGDNGELHFDACLVGW